MSELLRVAEISKSFGGLQVLSGVSFSISKDEIVSLIGPNGAGKTTLFNIITGLERADGGSILFDGQEILGIPAHKIARKGFARTFQHPRPFDNISVLENIMIGAFMSTSDIRSAQEWAAECADQVGLGRVANSSLGTLTLLERKFLEMARAIATRPAILLLDEVMTGLNPTELRDAIDVVRGIRASGTTVVLIEHVMNAVLELSDRIIVLADKEIIADGMPQEVVDDPRVLKAYLGEAWTRNNEGKAADRA